MKSNYHFKFEDLKVYHKAMDFGEYAVQLAHKFPKDEGFEQYSKLRRAADSVVLNILKGSSGTDRQFYNRLGTAWHSA